MSNTVPVQRHRLILEGHKCTSVVTLSMVYEFLINLTVKLKMRVLIPPVVVQVPIENHLPTDDEGISGQMMWMESGCQIHTWPKYEFVTVDIFSCKPFNIEDAEELFRQTFNPNEIASCVPVTRPTKGQKT